MSYRTPRIEISRTQGNRPTFGTKDGIFAELESYRTQSHFILLVQSLNIFTHHENRLYNVDDAFH